MKRARSISLTMLVLGMLVVLSAGHAEARGTVTLNIPYRSSSVTPLPTLDGAATDAFWSSVPSTTMNIIFDPATQPTNAADLFATFRAAWTRSGSVDRLYIFCDVQDETDQASGTVWNLMDSIEIYVDINNTTNSSYTGDVAAFNAGGPVQAHVNLNGTVGVFPNFTEILLTSSQSQFFVANPAGRSVYEGFMAFPTQNLNGKTINFGMAVNDADAGVREHHLFWLGDPAVPIGPPYTVNTENLTPAADATDMGKALLDSVPPVPQATPSASAPTINSVGAIILGTALLLIAGAMLKARRREA